jgi:hypothetical protein
MVLSAADKREIANMFNVFADRMGTGQQSRPAERFVYDYTTGTVIPAIGGAAEAFSQKTPIGIQRPEDILLAQALETMIVPTKRKKAMTKFNKAVKEGMKIVKASKSYGKARTINNPKKAFAAVTKAVSKARKGGKLSAKGVLRKVQQKAKQILGKEVRRRKKYGKGPAGKLAEMKDRLRLRR